MAAVETVACVYLLSSFRQKLMKRTFIVFRVSRQAAETVLSDDGIDSELASRVGQDWEMPEQAQPSRWSKKVCRLAIAHVGVNPVESVRCCHQGESLA